MGNNITTNPAEAALTQKELFWRFLDAPFYERSERSTLINTRTVSEVTVAEGFSGFNSGIWNELGYGWNDLHQSLLEELRDSESPVFDLDEIVSDLVSLLRELVNLQRGFDELCSAARTEEPDDNASDEEIREWEDSPRYVLTERKVPG